MLILVNALAIDMAKASLPIQGGWAVKYVTLYLEIAKQCRHKAVQKRAVDKAGDRLFDQARMWEEVAYGRLAALQLDRVLNGISQLAENRLNA